MVLPPTRGVKMFRKIVENVSHVAQLVGQWIAMGAYTVWGLITRR